MGDYLLPSGVLKTSFAIHTDSNRNNRAFGIWRFEIILAKLDDVESSGDGRHHADRGCQCHIAGVDDWVASLICMSRGESGVWLKYALVDNRQ
jgi:hypothetical protein